MTAELSLVCYVVCFPLLASFPPLIWMSWHSVVDFNSVNNHSIHTVLLHKHSSLDVMLWPCPHSLGSVSAHCCTNCTTLLSKCSFYCWFFICVYNTIVMISILCDCSSTQRTAFIFLHLRPQHFFPPSEEIKCPVCILSAGRSNRMVKDVILTLKVCWLIHYPCFE